jgi:hypothetical protein
MKTLILTILFSVCITNANADLTSQLNAVNDAQNQIEANNHAAQQEAYNAQQAEARRQENNVITQQNAERRLREEALQAQVSSNKAEMERAREAEANANAAAKARDNERLQDKLRAQTQEDEERNFIKAESELKLQQLKAQADAATALAAVKAKRANEIFESELKLENTKTDVIQSVADVNRIESDGDNNLKTGAGREKLYEFLIIVGLIVLIMLISVGVWKYYDHRKYSSPPIKSNSPAKTPISATTSSVLSEAK